MQHTLLGFGFALIAAIVAALAAPLFIDWNVWRAEFETRASMLVNAPVAIRGPIEATILPLPAFTLHDVVIGDTNSGSGLSTPYIRGEISLGALLGGRLQAEEIVLAKPDLRIRYSADGTINLPSSPHAAPAENFSISRVTFDDGSITLRNSENEETKYEAVSGFGSLQSRNGPFKLEFSCKEDERNFAIRVSANEFHDAAGKMRLSLARQDGFALEADGNLTLAEARPRFEGKTSLAQRSAGGTLWKLSGDARTDLQSIALDELQLSLGDDASAIELSGSAGFELRAGKFAASLAAKNVDLDRFGGKEAKQDLIAALVPLRKALTQAPIPLSGRITLAIDTLVAAGAVARDMKGEIALRQGAFLPQRLEARLPGLTAISFAARTQSDDAVTGGLKLAAEEPASLARWLGIGRLGLSFDAASLRLNGDARISKNGIALDPFTLAYEEVKWSGSASYSGEEAGKPARIDARLAAEKPDLVQLAKLPSAAESSGLEVKVSLDARLPKLFGSVARRLDTALSLAAGTLSLERLSIEDFDGLGLRARGELASWRDKPNGRIEIETGAAKVDGLVAIARAASGVEDLTIVRKIAAAAIPLQMTGALTGEGKSAEVVLELNGRANNMDGTITASFDPRAGTFGEASFAAEAKDAAQLVSLVGLPAPEPHAGQGRLEATIGRLKEGAFPLKADLAFPGISLAGAGEIRVAKGRIEPRLDLRLEATDARALSLAVARAADTVVPASGTARLVQGEGALVLEDIALGLADIRVHGRLSVKGYERPSLQGTLSLNRADLPALFGVMLGRPGESRAAPWPDRPLGLAALENAEGVIEIESAALNLVGPYVANNARLKLRFAGNEAAVDDLSGEVAGGKLTGQARVLRAKALVVDGKLSIAGGDIAKLTAPGAARSNMRGRADFNLQFTSQGDSPATLVANAAGEGRLSAEEFELDKLDPEAVLKIVPVPNAPPLSEAEAAAQLAFGLQRGPLRIEKLETPLLIVSGIARAGRARTSTGTVDIATEARLDLAKLDLDAAVGLAAAGSEKNAAQATVRFRGPLADIKRSVDTRALLSALSLQTIDAEMQQLEGPRPVHSLPSAPVSNVPLPRRRPAEVPPPAAAELPPLPPPLEIGPAPGNARPRFNPSLQ